MKIRIETQSTASMPYTSAKEIITKANGRQYKPVGKSFESHSKGWRCLRNQAVGVTSF